MRIADGVIERGGDAILENLGDDVLETIGLGVDVLPRHTKLLDEVELEQAMVAQHLERDLLALRRQHDAAVGLVLDQVVLVELLHHPGH